LIKSTSIVIANLVIFLRGMDNYKPYEAYFTVNFRECEAGEEFGSGTCEVCDSGFYSLIPGEELCKPCIDHANCTGGNKLLVEEGYWRDTKMRDEILECYWKESCLGGYIEKGIYPVLCDEGYQGVLCQDCVLFNETNGKTYMRNGRSWCDTCPSKVTNTFRIIGFSILVLFCIYVLIWFNIRKTKESEFSILFKIMTNYLQTATAAMSFNITYP